jgi:uncharacterized protein (DUF1800 family)
MGDENTVLDAANARHLLRRTGFGVKASEVDGYVGLTRGAAATKLLSAKPKPFKPSARDGFDQHNKWFKFLLKSKSTLNDKLVLFWHDHFSTAMSKVQDTNLMAEQVKLLYQNCKGNFKTLVKAMNKNAAMMEYLDTVRNDKEIPNENYARELQELFTLGVTDSYGVDTYTQDDIVQIARAFTGWTYDNRGDAYLSTDNHDYAADWPLRGPKIIFQTLGGFGPGGQSFMTLGEGENEIDEVVDILFDHTDSGGGSTVGRRTARRLLEYLAHPDPSLVLIDAVLAASGFTSTWDIAALVRAILVHDGFYESGAPAPFGPTTKKSVRWPIDVMLGSLRTLGLKPKSRYMYIAGGSYRNVYDHLNNMGQLVLDPPSVFGWDWETAWISSSTLLARYNLARDLVNARGSGSSAFRPDKVINLNLTSPGAIVDAVTDLFSITDQFTAPERQALIDYLTDNGAVATLNIKTDEHDREVKLHGLFALVMQSPQYNLH